MGLTTHLRRMSSAAGAIAVAGLASAPPGMQTTARAIAFVDVRDQHGAHVAGLRAANFRARYRGQPVAIAAVTEDAEPRRVAIVVDVSASEAESARSEWSEAEQLIDRLIPQHAVALFTLARTLRKFADFTTDRGAVQKAIQDAVSAGPAGSSSLYDGLAQLLEGFPAVRPGDAICLFSDGDDTSSRVSPDQLRRALETRGIRLFLLGTPMRWMHYASQVMTNWQSLADVSGGWAAWIDPAKQDAKIQTGVMEELAARIASPYRLELTLLRSVDASHDWKLEVIGSADRPLNKVTILYPRRLSSVD